MPSNYKFETTIFKFIIIIENFEIGICRSLGILLFPPRLYTPRLKKINKTLKFRPCKSDFFLQNLLSIRRSSCFRENSYSFQYIITST